MERQASIHRSTELIFRTMMSQATITSALELPNVFPEFKKNLFERHMTGKSPVVEVLTELKGHNLLEDRSLSTIAEGLATQATVNAESVLSAGAIVPTHSTADDVFTGACSLAIEAPDEWKAELNFERKITLGELREKGAEGVFLSRAALLERRLGAKPLPSRAELLFRYVPIRSTRTF